MNLLLSPIGRLRLLSILEGVSLLLLVFVGMPLKYGFNQPEFNSVMGMIHGSLFVLFIFSALHVSVEEDWKFLKTTWKVLVACLIPFGTFYIDAKILKPIYRDIER